MNIYITDLTTICNHDDLVNKLSAQDLSHYKSFTRPNRAAQFLVAHAIKTKIENQFGHISIAHKDNFVIVVASQNPIGVDIEDTSKQRDFNSLGNFMELSNIKTADDFYRAFTQYEAEYKANAAQLHPHFYKLRNYMICIVSNNQDVIWSNPALVPEQI